MALALCKVARVSEEEKKERDRECVRKIKIEREGVKER